MTINISSDLHYWVRDDFKVEDLVTGAHKATGIMLNHTPNKGLITVSLNGLNLNVGNGVTVEDCYFSDHPLGVTAKTHDEVKKGDQLFWNSHICGHELDLGDIISVGCLAATVAEGISPEKKMDIISEGGRELDL
jgi:hypothetical protein